MKGQIEASKGNGKRVKLKRPNRATICGWVRSAWDGLSSDTIANGFKASGLLPSENCIDSAGLIDDLEKLSLREGSPVDEEDDFGVNDILEEAVV
ncbi:hypothetical protein V7S43_017550 [Phytophthora oleae]|uniref:DDE-1 domain-containing protein n=1 Tax=Phytophthora oleae TaxID=2107226 RepID=A0ABD3ESV6_9STRA